MSCRTTRTLIDITAQCLQCLMFSDTESCINALLNTSVLHSPHFDWVVAHVGSCFPNTVITRVLTCGLKDFCANVNNPKLNSVVGILGHLAGSHFIDIRTALLDLFKVINFILITRVFLTIIGVNLLFLLCFYSGVWMRTQIWTENLGSINWQLFLFY